MTVFEPIQTLVLYDNRIDCGNSVCLTTSCWSLSTNECIVPKMTVEPIFTEARAQWMSRNCECMISISIRPKCM